MESPPLSDLDYDSGDDISAASLTVNETVDPVYDPVSPVVWCSDSSTSSSGPGSPLISADRPDSPVIGAERPDLPVIRGDMPDSSVISADMPDSPVISGDMPDSSVISADMPDASVINADISDSPVISGDIPDSPEISGDIPDSLVIDVGWPIENYDFGDFQDLLLPLPNTSQGPTDTGEGMSPAANDDMKESVDIKPKINENFVSGAFSPLQHPEWAFGVSNSHEENLNAYSVPASVTDLFENAKWPSLNMSEMFNDSLVKCPLVLFRTRTVNKIMNLSRGRRTHLSCESIAARLRPPPPETPVPSPQN